MKNIRFNRHLLLIFFTLMVITLCGIIERMNYKMIIQYDGTRYDGWQKQGNTDNTIQGKIEHVLSRMMECPVVIHGAGRTDAGVHARGQTANFHLKEWREPELIRTYLNTYLPEDIDVISLAQASERFHSRLNARSKSYCYRIGTDDHKDVFRRKERYHLGEQLDLEAMKKASGYLLGQHDFKSFCSNRRMKKSTVRRLDAIDFQADRHGVDITYSGNGFLYHMVRILTGVLIEVGQGKRSPEEVRDILEAKDRNLTGGPAPAHGLTLMEITY